MALYGVTYVTFSLYPIQMILQKKIISFIVFFIINLRFSLQLSKRYFVALFRPLNIILISCIVGQILAVDQGHPLQNITCRKVYFL